MTARFLKQQFEVVDACRDRLADHNTKALLADLNEQEAAGEN
jgi:hypothetical protein